MNITDEDNVPLELLDDILGAHRHKVHSKFALWIELVESANAETAKKIK